jgi:hypothetical protein
MSRFKGIVDRVAKQRLAIVDLPYPVSRETEDQLEKENADAIEKLGKELTNQARSHYWEPGHSLSINIPLTSGLNLWRFSIFGAGANTGFSGKGIWEPDYGELLVNPHWIPARDLGANESIPSYKWPKVVDGIIKLVKNSETVKSVADAQLKGIEAKLGLEIPSDVRGDIIAYAEASAKRRLGIRHFPGPKGRSFVIAPPKVAVQARTAGQRVNPKHVELTGEVSIRALVKELKETMAEIENWQEMGAKTVSGDGSEWIPYY